MVTYEEILKKVESFELIEQKINFIESILDKVDEDTRKKLEVYLKDLQEDSEEPLEQRLEGQPTHFSTQIDQIDFHNYEPREAPRREEPALERQEPTLPRVTYEIVPEVAETAEQRLTKLTNFLEEYELLPESGRTATSNVDQMRQKIRDFYEGSVSPEKEESLIDAMTRTDDRGKYMIGRAPPPPTRVAEILAPEDPTKKYKVRRIHLRG